MKIKINPYNPKSIQDALNAVQTMQNSFNEKVSVFIEKIASIGYQTASVGFSLADYDGTNDVVVSIDGNGSKLMVKACGMAVCFIEFGSGVRYGNGYPERPSGIAGIGEYGKGQGKNEKGWFYGSGQHSYGNPPAMAMLTARDSMIEQVTQIAREVFR